MAAPHRKRRVAARRRPGRAAAAARIEVPATSSSKAGRVRCYERLPKPIAPSNTRVGRWAEAEGPGHSQPALIAVFAVRRLSASNQLLTASKPSASLRVSWRETRELPKPLDMSGSNRWRAGRRRVPAWRPDGRVPLPRRLQDRAELYRLRPRTLGCRHSGRRRGAHRDDRRAADRVRYRDACPVVRSPAAVRPRGLHP